MRVTVERRHRGGPVPLELRLTAREREILLAGGLIAYARTA